MPLKIDNSVDLLNAVAMDALKERVLNERIRILQAKLEVAIRQRNGFATDYHAVARVPFQERRESIRECDDEIERAGELKNSGQID